MNGARGGVLFLPRARPIVKRFQNALAISVLLWGARHKVEAAPPDVTWAPDVAWASRPLLRGHPARALAGAGRSRLREVPIPADKGTSIERQDEAP